MTRRAFISYEGEDRNRAKGFRLLKWNQNVELDIFDRHLLDPVNSQDPAYIKQCIRDQMKGCSVVVVLIGEKTAKSDWVDWEVRYAMEQGKGVLGIVVKDGGQVEIPQCVKDAGAEVIPWEPAQFNEAIERAAVTAGYVGSPASAPGGSAGDTSVCAR